MDYKAGRVIKREMCMYSRGHKKFPYQTGMETFYVPYYTSIIVGAYY